MVFKKLLCCMLFISVFFIFACKQSDFDKAVAYQKDGEYEKAMQLYKQAVENKDHIDVSEKNMGDICFSEKKYVDAFQHYLNSIENNPNYCLDTVLQFVSYNGTKVRSLACQTLSEIKNETAKNKIFSAFSETLKSGDKYKILDYLEVVFKFKQNAKPVIGDVINLLDGEDTIIKQKVLDILPTIQQDVLNENDMNKVIVLLNQEDEILKNSAIKCLEKMGSKAKQAIPSLIDVIINQPDFKQQSISALNKVGIPTIEQARTLYVDLKDKPKEVRELVLNQFLNTKEDTSRYVPYIMPFLNDQDSGIKQLTRNVLTKIGKSSVQEVKSLIDLLQDSNDEIKMRAIFELGDLGKASKDAIEPLQQIVETTTNQDVKKMATEALNKIK